MKKTILKFAAITVLAITLNACSKNNSSTPSTPASTTPSFTATMNGTATTFTGSATSGSNYFQITGINTSTYTVELFLYKFAGAGTYSIATNNGTDSYPSVSTQSGQSWYTGTGSVTISSYNTTAKTISGTFSLNLSGSGSLTVTNGSFANIAYN
ncbi:MAG TPA: hypothetical protein VK783_00555 [Bacteroidia bacterium]|jgi:hypothetical protein|nr:hypothetical protein [Bacteroidia bacterium]